MAESLEAEVREDESVEAELGVEDSLERLQSLSIDRLGLEGRPCAEQVEDLGASYALENVLRMVGETALRVSRRRLVEPLPNVRTC